MPRIGAAELRYVSGQTDSAIKGLTVLRSSLSLAELTCYICGQAYPASQLIQIVVVDASRLLLLVIEESTGTISLAHSTL